MHREHRIYNAPSMFLFPSQKHLKWKYKPNIANEYLNEYFNEYNENHFQTQTFKGQDVGCVHYWFVVEYKALCFTNNIEFIENFPIV